MKTKIEKVRLLLDRNWGSPKEIAERVGCHVSQIHHEVKRRREQDESYGLQKMDPPRDDDDKSYKPSPPVTMMEIQLGNDANRVEVKLRNRGGELTGTLVLESRGLRYRRPNQKLQADRVITWATLDKIIQLGLV